MPALPTTPPGPVELPAGARHLVLFDGECGLCDRAVQSLLAADRGAVLAYAPLQGETAAALRARLALEAGLDSMVFVQDFGTARERVLVRSRAALAAAGIVGGFWRVLGVLRLLPRPFGDWLYGFVARHRYRWFGQLASCRLPTTETAARFLP